MSAADWVLIIGALVTLVTAIGASVLAIVKVLKDGQAAKQDPEVEGSGAAICEELRKGREEQRRFNAALALHLGMGEGLVDGGLAVREKATREANGR